MTLSELSLQLRLMAKLAALFCFVILFFGIIIFFIVISAKKPTNQTVFIDPKFNKIERPVFDQALSTQPPKFILDTIDGEIPEATATAKVYFIPQKETLLSAKKKILNIAEQLGFNIETVNYNQVDEKTVRLEDEYRTLVINTSTYFFNFYYKSTPALQELLNATPEANYNFLETSLEQNARNFLINNGYYFSWLSSGKTNKIYEKYDLGKTKFIPVAAAETPQALRIDFFRADLDLPVVTSEYWTSHNYLVYCPLINNATIVEGNFASFEKLELEPGIYPLLTKEEAWNKLINKEVKTITLAENTKEVKIQQMYVAYFDPPSYQQFFQPIFVFVGNNNYVGYLPAIKEEYFIK